MAAVEAKSRGASTPYCNNCGYDLSKLTESSRCPECGRPFVEVLTRGPRLLESGRRYRSKATLFGLPVIDIALGPRGGQLRGRAKGIIAIGDIATGGIAIGGVARGVVAVGGLAIGGFTFGGGSIGLFTALGGGAIGGIAVGGGAMGGIAQGGGALGFIAQGGGAVGYFARGASAMGVHTISMQPPHSDPAAVRAFERISFITGTWPPANQFALLSQMAFPVALTLAAAVIVALVAMFAMGREPEP